VAEIMAGVNGEGVEWIAEQVTSFRELATAYLPQDQTG
jgi:hypothetical protein